MEFAWTNRWYYRSQRGEYVIPATCLLVILTVILIVPTSIISFAGLINERCPGLLPADLCPKGWLLHQRKCYYFSIKEGNWISGSRHCSSHNAFLAIIDSQEELDFLFYYKGPPDHWIGLQKDPGQPWQWVNGSIFTEQLFRLPFEEGRRCAYLNHKAVASSSCTREERWICSKDMFKGSA
ncbi:C-type lectin domain family 2 member D-like [Anolis sagrei]|uniref:C-type lectin domain family 2 member D-like n=1 Tax=Anolis sagrei TaxID=38937 RepID=UPI0035206095